MLIAPATDMTQELMWNNFNDNIKDTIKKDGIYLSPSEYDDEPYEITKALIDDGKAHLILNKITETFCPVRIIQGQNDVDVPWQHSIKTANCLKTDDLTITLVKHGDHRLSSQQDIQRLQKIISEI